MKNIFTCRNNSQTRDVVWLFNSKLMKEIVFYKIDKRQSLVRDLCFSSVCLLITIN